MQLGTHLECIESSPRVSGVYQDGAREFAGRRLRLIGILSGVAERLVGSFTMTVKRSCKPYMDPGTNLGIGPRFGRCDGSSSRVH
ncbi:hypothetical protein BHE74_00034992 [Ensete ventricosum]|nr:hypothetical protein GW17_00061798 [Ensete ventricosum]RWW58168.1 hypothetical protein BHE74_00034992 [Ensete ventricosum]RZS18936.1 hypothetical protein BHM03_00051261 [Ensete ventricosum]